MEKYRKKQCHRKKETNKGAESNLYRLLICIGIFLAVFLGRGVFPVQTQEWRAQLLEVICQDTDFKAVFGGLGEAVAEDAPALGMRQCISES